MKSSAYFPPPFYTKPNYMENLPKKGVLRHSDSQISGKIGGGAEGGGGGGVSHIFTQTNPF